EAPAAVAEERTRDHARQAVLLPHLASRLAPGVQRLERHPLLLGGDLEDAVRAGIDDGQSGAEVLLSQLVEDHRPARRLVAQGAGRAGLAEPVLHQLRREAVREGGEALLQDDPHHLPVAGGGVLALRLLRHPPECGPGRGRRRTTRDGGDVAEPPALQIGQLQAADLARAVGQRVGAGVSVSCGVRKLAGTAGVDHDGDESAHQGPLRAVASPATIATLALVPNRLAPASIILRASAAVRMPPLAFPPTSSPTIPRSSATPPTVAP